MLKPVDNEDLKSTVAKALYNSTQKNALQKNITFIENLKAGHFQKKKLVIPVQEGLEFVEISSIIRCEGVDGYTKIFLNSNKTILSSNSIGYFNKLLDFDGFYLVHKSHLVNLDYTLKYLNEGCLIMVNQEHIPVARNKRAAFLQFISHREKL